MDRRALPGLFGGLAGCAFGVVGAVANSPVVTVIAATCALVAGASSMVLLDRARSAERQAAIAVAEVMFLLKKFPRIIPVARPSVPSSPTVRISAVTSTSIRVNPRVSPISVSLLVRDFLTILVDLHVTRRSHFDGLGTARIAHRYGRVGASGSAPVKHRSGAATGYCEGYVGIIGL